MRSNRTVVVFAAALAVAGCGGDHSQPGDHSVAEVSSALHAVGLDGFHPIHGADGRGKLTPGINAEDFAGGFSFVRLGHGGQHPPVVAISIAIAKDPSVVGRVEQGFRKQRSDISPVTLHFARAGNVLIVSVSEHPDPPDRRILSRIPRLVAYLDAH